MKYHDHYHLWKKTHEDLRIYWMKMSDQRAHCVFLIQYRAHDRMVSLMVLIDMMRLILPEIILESIFHDTIVHERTNSDLALRLTQIPP